MGLGCQRVAMEHTAPELSASVVGHRGWTVCVSDVERHDRPPRMKRLLFSGAFQDMCLWVPLAFSNGLTIFC